MPKLHATKLLMGKTMSANIAELELRPGDPVALRVPARHEAIGNCSIVWIPVWSRPALEALRYAATVSDRVVA